MEMILFLSSGLFLGWSLGANDAANVFGTAVGTRMVKFHTAALVCSVFIVLGATISGAGAAHTLGRLGAVNALAGSFTVALASALTTFWMTRLSIPVSTSQSIVGAIIGWNLYSSSVTDTSSLSKIVVTWVACPVISAVIAVLVFMLVRWLLRVAKPHMLRLDSLTRLGLLLVGAFGSYSLGANNIANVMGVFIPDNPFTDIHLFGFVTITGVQQLFLLGAVAIAVGVFTYSERVMGTVGGGLARISPVPALVIVLAQSLTLFLFASEGLEHFLASHGLPTFPLVPVSSSQAVIGAVIGVSLFRGGHIRYRVLGEISLGWVATPVMAGIVAFLLLFVVENVFDQKVQELRVYRLDAEVGAELHRRGVDDPGLAAFAGRSFTNPVRMKSQLKEGTSLTRDEIDEILELSLTGHWEITAGAIARDIDKHWFTSEQIAALRSLQGRGFDHTWQLEKALAEASPQWQMRPEALTNKIWNKDLASKLSVLHRVFRMDETDE
jgi:PiT family inorganic phosphate transporter